MNRKLLSILSFKLLCVALFAGCTAASKEHTRAVRTAEETNSAPAPVLVQVFEVQTPAAANELLVPATVAVEGTALVLAQREGVVTQLGAQEGERVSKGQTIAVLGNDDQLTQLRQAELEVSRLKLEEQQYDSFVSVNRNELERERQLFKDGVSSQRDLERAQFRLEGAVSELEKTRLATKTAQSKVEAVKYEIEKGTVRAPVAGLVTRRHVSVGSGVVKNDKLFEISPAESLQVKFQLPQAERHRLGAGSLVTLTLPGSDRAVAQARIRRLDPVADPASNTFGYLADVLGRAQFIPGTAVNVHVPRPASAQTFWIPRAAFPHETDLRAGATATLLVVENGRCADRMVLLSAVEGDHVEVASGLAAGERVIIAPPLDLKPGDAVEES
ncbi:MAG TPA: efflux RND transporter periplasmic adaptor subunit [Pyrinomonadaceae bacterium]|nr:efflux RND transporter periplasmic adaptor subunit [Pyrinomonadaceae bacterium]